MNMDEIKKYIGKCVDIELVDLRGTTIKRGAFIVDAKYKSVIIRFFWINWMEYDYKIHIKSVNQISDMTPNDEMLFKLRYDI